MARCPILALVAVGCAHPTPQSLGPQAETAVTFSYLRLENGLRVTVSRDPTTPLVRLGVYYGVGPREEPQGRAGFAHLFEHFMFEGSEHLKPREYFDLVVSSGGRFGARTLYDFTKYTATVPKNALELLLWAEADRMRAPRLTQDRLDAVRATVKSEVRQQAFDRPYGRFVWIDVPELTQTRWENSHSIYGETADGKMEALDAATVDDARAFFRTYYTPRNASLAIYGDVDPDEAIALVRKYFAPIPAGLAPPAIDRREPPQQSEKRFVNVDSNAARPALAIAYHLPPRSSPDFWVMGIIDQILVEGRDSWMHASLVQRRGITDAVYGGLSPRHGSMYTINGPNFWAAYAFHDPHLSPDTLLAGMDAEIERLRSAPVPAETLQRAINKSRADFYAEWNTGFGEGRVDMLGQLALFDGDPGRINRIDKQFRDITAEMVLRVAREYLAPRNRAVLQLRTKGDK